MGIFSYFAVVLEEARRIIGEMLEWLKRHAWKACKPLKGFAGSNPALSKVLLKPGAKVLIFFDYARVSLANLHRDAMSGCDYLAHPIFIGNRVNSKG